SPQGWLSFLGRERLCQCGFHPMQGHICEQRANYATLWGSLVGWRRFQPFHDSGFEPALTGPSHGRIRCKLFYERLMRDSIEAASNIRVQYPLGFVAGSCKYGFNGIVLSSSRSKSIPVGFKARFPFWLQSLLG